MSKHTFRRNAFLWFATALFFLTFASACNKCMVCKRFDKEGNLLEETPEVCGPKRTLDQEEQKVKDRTSVIVGSYYSCTRD